ncbi:MAG TPA: anti-sigma factor [Casimicrobiaceae bacterium]|jgi:anti-sigma-K factor RskA|nr:anti-sigma factor [Casimicrobiaceae bacterium]
MNYRTPERADALAAQYVLGTLSARARARFARLARGDAVLDAAIRGWEDRLSPLAQSVMPVEPPARVWSAILARIDRAAGSTPERRTVWATVSLWRGLALTGFATAIALALVLLAPPLERPAATLVVVLAGQDAKPAFVASADRNGRLLTIKAVAPVSPGADRSLQLWALPAAGNPRSLGLVPASGVVQIALPVEAGTALQNIPALAVSLEPRGGSPTGLPTGPVLYSGPVERLY